MIALCVSAFAVKVSGNFLYSAAERGNRDGLLVGGAFAPDTAHTLTLLPGVPRDRSRPVYCFPLSYAQVRFDECRAEFLSRAE